ncbi:MAG: MmcQ/YjbR family DNA-binding protein [Pseudomonadales bacterium]|jgi:predicted DNA-binding protein (MmcQ/YjbR family)|nr:MmcQ/YjbR family DNA-binding protein [Pseudomonadales bacterium]
MTRNELLEYVRNQYGTEPDFPWMDDDVSIVLRHIHNRKWYGLLIKIPKSKFGLDSDEIIDVINLKTKQTASSETDTKMGIYPAWHMNKKYWISVILNNEKLTKEQICKLIDESYELTK